MIPLVSALAFLPSLLSAGGPPERLWSLLGVLSLLATAYTMRHAPLQPDRKGKKPLSIEYERLAWVRTALVPANGVVCLLLTVVYLYLRGDSSYAIRPVLYLVPGGRSSYSSAGILQQGLQLSHVYSTAMLAIILLARELMLSVDLSALKDLQYEYKGA